MAKRDSVIIRVDKDFAKMLRNVERARSKQVGFDMGLPLVTKPLSQPPMEQLMKMQLSKRRKNLFKII